MRRIVLGIGLLALGVTAARGASEQPPTFEALGADYGREIRPLMKDFCLKCHSTEESQGDLDLERFASVDHARRDVKVWLKVAEMLDNGEMPPRDARDKLAPEQRKRIRAWVSGLLNAQAHASAGDPGPVVLRRLSNAEYTYTVHDLTALDLNPAREFPADGAAGEGFTNTGNALVMSPALLTKYFDAGKAIASHAFLLPDGFRFSPGDSRRDWTDEKLADIRALYARHADPEGRIPLARYLAATIEERAALTSRSKTLDAVAAARGLNARYLGVLWKVLNDHGPSLPLDVVRARWRAAGPGDVAALAAEIDVWQKALARFQSVGHMKPWVVAVDPLVSAQELRFKFPANTDAKEVTLYLTAGDAGDGDASDVLVWQRPRLVMAGRPDLPLRDLQGFVHEMVARRDKVFAAAARCLNAAAEATASETNIDREALARKHDLDPDALAAWLDYLGIGASATIRLDHFKNQLPKVASYDFVKGWGSPETPNLIANASDQHVRVPGNMKAHGVAVHPSPTLQAAVGWRSPITGAFRVAGNVTHAHPECGNGVTWSLELRRGATRQRLAGGVAAGANGVKIGAIESLAVRPGDLVSLLIGPRDGNHACDLTAVDLTLTEDASNGKSWDLAHDVSGSILASNPHPDSLGHEGIWHFYTEPVQGGDKGAEIPAGSLLARWVSTPDPATRRQLADDVQKLLLAGAPAKDSPDAALYRQLSSLGGPLFAGRLSQPAEAVKANPPANPPADATWGLDPGRFGKHPDGSPIDPASLCVKAPSVLAIRLPADLVAGCEFVTTAAPHPSAVEGTTQPRLLTAKPEGAGGTRADTPILVAEGSPARARLIRDFSEFRCWLPLALCYTKIVPVDEVVTLTLFHREDEPLQRLMLDDAEIARLNRHWDELHFVSQDALTLVDAFAQLMEYATQDSDPRMFEPFRKPIQERAAAYRQALLDAQPAQLDAVVAFARRAYRRPLTAVESRELRDLYQQLRREELPHDDAIRLTLARVFVSPAFLYRLEKAGPGADAVPVNDWELASRLSYFLWSSAPDDALASQAAAGRLHEPAVVAAEARRMLRDPKIRRLATEFACQWLHVYDFDTLDEKSERHFPTFSSLRSDMYEETIRFFTDLFQNDGSIASIFDSDHTFLNESLARHYGIANVVGPEWRRVEGVRSQGRGGILGFATTLAKQSGASRTSPILRGNWVSEVLLGEKLPRPPKDVPRLPEDEGESDLTVRQLVEKHSRDERCAGCHVRIDPIGYALEGFDAIGRRREVDLAGRPIDTRSQLQNGTRLDGVEGLRRYLMTDRREVVVRQFCRKLLGYALGRAVQLSDEPLLDDIQASLKSRDDHFSTAVEMIVRSPQFREIRGKNSPLAELP